MQSLSGKPRTADQRIAANAAAATAAAGPAIAAATAAGGVGNSNGNVSPQPPPPKRPRFNKYRYASPATVTDAHRIAVFRKALEEHAAGRLPTGVFPPGVLPLDTHKPYLPSPNTRRILDSTTAAAGGAGVSAAAGSAGGAGVSAAAAGGAGVSADPYPDHMRVKDTRFNRIGFSSLYQSQKYDDDIGVFNIDNDYLHETKKIEQTKGDRSTARSNMAILKANINQIQSIRQFRENCGISLRPATRLLTSLMSSLFYQSAKNSPLRDIFTYKKLMNYNVYKFLHGIMYNRLKGLNNQEIPLNYILGDNRTIAGSPDYSTFNNFLETIYGTSNPEILSYYYRSILGEEYDRIINCSEKLFIHIKVANQATTATPATGGAGTATATAGGATATAGGATATAGGANERIYILIQNGVGNKYYHKRTLSSAPTPAPAPIIGVTDFVGVHVTIFPTMTIPTESGTTDVIDSYHISDYYEDVRREQEYFHAIGIPILPRNRTDLAHCSDRINILDDYLQYLKDNHLYINTIKQLSLYGIDHSPLGYRTPPTDSPQRIKMRYVMVPLQWYNHLYENTRSNIDPRYNQAREPNPANTLNGGGRKQLQNRRKNRITKIQSNSSRLNRKRTCRRRK